MTPPFPANRAASDKSVARVGFLAAFLLALVASGSVVTERLAHGESSLTTIWTIGVMFTAVLVLIASRLRTNGTILRANLLGAGVALALVHVGLLIFATSSRLTEGPAQLVNDLVLTLAILALVWSLGVRRPIVRIGLPALALALVALYSATAQMWHLDPFPGLAVQHYVIAQIGATAAGLLVFDLLRPPR